MNFIEFFERVVSRVSGHAQLLTRKTWHVNFAAFAVVAFQFAATSASAAYEFGIRSYDFPPPVCAARGGDPSYGNLCVFPDGESACKAVIKDWQDNPEDFRRVFDFVSWGLPYVDDFGNSIDPHWCILQDRTHPEIRFTVYGSYFPAVSASEIVRCSPGTRNDEWRTYVPGIPATLPVCSLVIPPKNNFCSTGDTPDPINIGTGNKWKGEIDFIGVGGRLRFERTFNLTQPNAWGNLGYGWTHTYARSLKPSIASAFGFSAQRADGKAYVASFNPTSATYAFDADVNLRLTELKDSGGARTGWRLDTDTDETELYGASGQLLSIMDRNGQTQALTYSDATTAISVAPSTGLLIQVDDSFGRSFKFTYDSAARLSTLTTPANEVVTYSYSNYTYTAYNTPYSHLSSALYPGGAIRTYLYENNPYNNQPHGLTGILDENNNRELTWAYDIDGRAISSKRGGNVASYSITRTRDASFNTTSAVVTDPLGAQRTYNFQTILGVVKTTGVSQPCPSCGGAQSQATTYDTNGNVASRIDFNNKKVCYAYDLSRNLETARVEGLSSSAVCSTALGTTVTSFIDADTRKTEATWHSAYRLPLTITEPAASVTVGGTPGIKTTVFTYDTSGNLLQKDVTAPKNDGTSATETRTWKWTYNALGQVLTAEDALANTSATVYYAATDTAIPPKYTKGDIYTVTNAAGHVSTFNEYDKNGRLLKMSDPNGLITTMTYHPRGWLTSRAVSQGVVDKVILGYTDSVPPHPIYSKTPVYGSTEITQYAYDNVGQLTRVTMPDGTALNYAYDAAHRMVGMSDGSAVANGLLANLTGNKIIYTLDNMGNRTREDHYDPSGTLAKRKQRAIDSLNRLKQDIGGTSYASAAPGGAPTIDGSVVSPPTNAAVTQYGYDNNNNLTTTTDPLGRLTTNAYDALNRLVKVIDPYNGSIKPTDYVYDQAGNLVTVTDPQGLTTTYTYNGHNNLITQASPDTGSTKFTYNAMGNVVTKFDAMNRCSFSTYDDLHRVTQMRHFAASNAATNTAATCAAATTVTTTVDEMVSYTYDVAAMLQGEVESSGGLGGRGRLTRIDDSSGTHEYIYDRNGRVVSKTQTTLGVTNPAKTVTYGYNDVGQLSQMTTPSGQSIEYVYGDPESSSPGKVISVLVNGIEVVKDSAYEPFGPNGGWSWGNHDGSSLINQHLRVFDKDSRPTAISSDPEGYNRNIAWDRANRITGITVPGTSGGTATITIPGMTNALSANQAYGYDALDRLTSMTPGYPGATTAATGQGLLPAEGFTYDAIGNRITRVVTPPGSSASTSTYSYPNTSATSAPNRNHTLTGISGSTTWNYLYDATGNTTKEGSNPANTATTAFTNSYDSRNRLVQVQQGSNSADTATYKYNALGQRVQKTGAGTYGYSTSTTVNTTTGLSPQAASLPYNARYVYDEQGRLLGEYGPDGELIAETIWFDDLPVATLRPSGSSVQAPLGVSGNVEIYYLHPDHLGTPRTMTRSAAVGGATSGPNAINKAVWRWESDPFGSSGPTGAGGSAASAPNENPQNVTGTASQITAASFKVNNRFPGQLFDAESTKSYNYFRDYDSSIGRYTTSDPIGLKGGLSTFGYVGGSPIFYSDPNGLDRWGGVPSNDGYFMNGSRFCKCDNITIVRRGLCSSCGDDGDKEYGHYWIEVGNASYGWWPQGPVGAGSAGDLTAIGGVPGAINQVGIPERGRRPPQDPYHGRRDGSEEAFNPRPNFWPRGGTCASVCAAAASCIARYARGYAGRSGGNWSLLGNSCRDFQKGAMGACGLQ